MKAKVTFTLHKDASEEALSRIVNGVLTMREAADAHVRTNTKLIIELVTNDVMNLLQRFESDGFELEVDFAEVRIVPVR